NPAGRAAQSAIQALTRTGAHGRRAPGSACIPARYAASAGLSVCLRAANDGKVEFHYFRGVVDTATSAVTASPPAPASQRPDRRLGTCLHHGCSYAVWLSASPCHPAL